MSNYPITHENLISKLCYAKYGGSIQENEDSFSSELYKFLRSVPDAKLTRQAIRHWIKNNGVPKRAEAVKFLHQYFEVEINQKELKRRSQKKVRDQIHTFLKRESRKFKDHNIGLSNTKRLIIDQPLDENGYSEVMKNWVGCYFVYHTRLTENTDYPITREFVEIYSTQNELHFFLFDQNESGIQTEFSGNLILVGNSIWLIGISNTSPKRLKTMVFRNIQTENTLYDSLKWGILSSDMPRQGSPEPVSCRIVFQKIEQDFDTSFDAGVFAKKHVAHISGKDCESNEMNLIYRMVNNNFSAASLPQSTNPISNTVPDSVLKVNQETLERTCEKLYQKSSS